MIYLLSLLEYWEQIVSVVSIISLGAWQYFTVRNNKKRISDLEEKLNSKTTNKWVEFKAKTEVRLDQLEKADEALFAFHNNKSNGRRDTRNVAND